MTTLVKPAPKGITQTSKCWSYPGAHPKAKEKSTQHSTGEGENKMVNEKTQNQSSQVQPL